MSAAVPAAALQSHPACARLLSAEARALAPRCVAPDPATRAWRAGADGLDPLSTLEWRCADLPELRAALAGLDGVRAAPAAGGLAVALPLARLGVLERPEAPPVLGLLAAAARARLAPAGRPAVLGVLNVTPDSFSDGGRFTDVAAAVAQARRLVDEGADWIDVGAESTRPGSDPVDVDEELRRCVPVLDALAEAGLGERVSIDTRRAAVAGAALERGARLVNDVSAGTHDPDLLPLVAERGAFLCLMHMRGTPKTMQDAPRYDDVVEHVTESLRERAAAAVAAGVDAERLVLDPGLGFGKTLEHNLALVARLGELRSLGAPLLVGASRKRFVGHLSGVEPPAERLAGSIAAATAAALAGAAVLRVHDVAPHVQALGLAGALAAGPAGSGRP